LKIKRATYRHIEAKIHSYYAPRELELRSTIIFVDNDAVTSGREITRNDFIQEIRSIKPYFSYEEIKEAMEELESRGCIERRK
jgi:hypothetical protein